MESFLQQLHMESVIYIFVFLFPFAPFIILFFFRKKFINSIFEKVLKKNAFGTQEVPFFLRTGADSEATQKLMQELQKLQMEGKIQGYRFVPKSSGLQTLQSEHPEKSEMIEKLNTVKPIADSIRIILSSEGYYGILKLLMNKNFQKAIDSQLFLKYRDIFR